MIELLNSPNFDLFLKLLIYSSVFIGMFVLVFHLFPNEAQEEARRRLGVHDISSQRKTSGLLHWLRPFYVGVAEQMALASLPAIFSQYIERKRPQFHRLLVSANMRDAITPDQFIALKVVTTILVPLLLFVLTTLTNYGVPPFLWPLFFVAGFFAPEQWLRETIRLRRRSIIRAMPYTLDLLTLSVEAGLDFMAAISRLTQRVPKNPLLEEFNQMLREIRLGSSRSDALRNISDRLQIEEMSSFATLLIQADQLGASIGPVLRAQSDQLRSQRFQAAETAGAKASQMALFPLVFCILPTVFLLIMGPAALNFLQGGGLR